MARGFIGLVAAAKPRLSLASLVSGRWQAPRAFFRDLGLAVAFMVIVVPLVSVLAVALGANDSLAAAIVPKTVIQLSVSLALAASAGFSEELIFRGYLTRQFSAWTGSARIGLVLQGIVFGLAHGYYGKAMIAVMVQGWLLGLLAYWRKSLRPGMLAHWLQDTLGNVVGFFS